ncbi:hypothetical protein GDO81_000186 [Engystomops pustulosus]|uniref:Uncharacterized protein n=1 Tax=Engystomops pustulosus TaxID=76066 RepID=A0AAV7D464_ENGPU|nr:hypothetical protein GDO81_000186 [Engystomops pustulosus]
MRFLRICLHSPHPPYPKLIRTLLHLTWCRLGPSLTLGLVIYCRRRELRGLPRSRSQRFPGVWPSFPVQSLGPLEKCSSLPLTSMGLVIRDEHSSIGKSSSRITSTRAF